MPAPVARLRRRAAVALCAAAVAACGEQSGTERTAAPEAQLPAARRAAPANLVLLTLDTTRADHLGAYGYPVPTSPHLDALAARGVVFERAYAPMGQTLPSHATLFTGLEPREHGVMENHAMLPQRVATLAEVFADAGHETAAFVGSYVLQASTGTGQGFEVFDEPERELVDGIERRKVERDARAVTDAALAWAAERDASRPFLLWVHYFDPHMPYEPPPAVLERVPAEPVRAALEARGELGERGLPLAGVAQIVRMYDAEILYMDAEIGRLLEGLAERGMMADTAVVVAGDHGEGLYEHGEQGHGVNVFEELVRVPLIMVAPDGAGAGRRVTEPVRLAEAYASMRAMAGLAGPEDAAGAWSRAFADEPAPKMPIFLERPHYPDDVRERRGIAAGGVEAVVFDGWKLVRDVDGAVSLYDLEADPEELRDVGERHADRRARMLEWLDAWLAANPVEATASDALDPERRRALEQLGY